jgi:hypothetical protein
METLGTLDINKKNKYVLGICQLYNPLIHGKTDKSIYSHYLYLFNIKNIYRYKQRKLSPQIIQIIHVNDSEGNVVCCAILKTFWLKIIQRKWKKIMKQRNHILSLRKQPTSLFHREIYGRWNKDFYYLPTLLDMFL